MTNWRVIPGTAGRYSVSDEGHISGPRRMLKPAVSSVGYSVVTISWEDGTRKLQYVHRLVLLAFVGAAPEDHEANHINGIKTDNRVENLEWVTKSVNCAHRSQVLGKVTKEGHGRSKLTEADVTNLRAMIAGDGRERRKRGFWKPLEAQFGLSRSALQRAAYGATWA